MALENNPPHQEGFKKDFRPLKVSFIRWPIKGSQCYNPKSFLHSLAYQGESVL